MQGLCLHAGASRVSWDAVESCETPEPEYRGEKMARQYIPVRHADLVKTTWRHLEGQGYRVVNAEHALTKGGHRYFGLLELAHTNDDVQSEIIGLRNSDDGAFLASIVMGGRVFVCDNMSFHGEIKVGDRKSVV